MPAAGLEAVAVGDGMPTIYVAREQLVETCRALRDTPELRFAFLADLLPVDYLPREPRFEIVYLLASLGMSGFGDTPKRLRVKVRVPGHDPTRAVGVERVAGGDWSEREAYDLFGIHFSDHPDLRRILMPDDWEGFPLRKDYPGADQAAGEDVRAAAGLAGAVRRQHRGDARSSAERLMDRRAAPAMERAA